MITPTLTPTLTAAALTSPVAPRYAPRFTELLTLDQAAAYLGLHANTVRRYIREGKLAAFAIGNKYVVSTDEMLRFVQQRPGADQSLKG
jgi:excisionase family DNA binding protein